MIRRKHLLYAGMLALCTVGLAACGDDETYDVYGETYNRVYVLDTSASFKIVQTPVSTENNVDFEWPARCVNSAEGDIKVTVAVDNSLVATYNKQHGTEYEAMPTEAIVLENAVMTIPAGSKAVADTVRLRLTDNKEVLAKLKSEKGYVIPVVLASSEGRNARLSSNMAKPVYLTVTVTEDNVNHDATEYTGTGTLVADQSGWSATALGSGNASNLHNWFDGDPQSTGSMYDWNSYKASFIVDMGKSYTFDAIAAYWSSSWGGDSNAIGAGSIISISEDGTNYKKAGEVTGDSKYIVFYSPVTARYIRVETASYSMRCGVFNVYEKK